MGVLNETEVKYLRLVMMYPERLHRHYHGGHLMLASYDGDNVTKIMTRLRHFGLIKTGRITKQGVQFMNTWDGLR